MSRKAAFKTVPRPYLVLGIVSITLNLFVLIAIVILKLTPLTYAEVNSSLDTYCSDEFRQLVQKTYAERGQADTEGKRRLALVDYSCSKNGAGVYFEKGYKEYIRSIGIEEK